MTENFGLIKNDLGEIEGNKERTNRNI